VRNVFEVRLKIVTDAYGIVSIEVMGVKEITPTEEENGDEDEDE